MEFPPYAPTARMRLNFGTSGERPSQHCGGLYARGVPARGHSHSRFESRASRTEPYSSRRRTGTAAWSSRRFRSPLEVFMGTDSPQRWAMLTNNQELRSRNGTFAPKTPWVLLIQMANGCRGAVRRVLRSLCISQSELSDGSDQIGLRATF